MARKAIMHSFLFEIICPVCKEQIENPEDGFSHNFSIFQEVPMVVRCHDCGIDLEVPRRLPSVKLSGKK